MIIAHAHPPSYRESGPYLCLPCCVVQALDGVGAVLTLLRSEPPINPQPDRVQRGLLLLQATASLPGTCVL